MFRVMPLCRQRCTPRRLGIEGLEPRFALAGAAWSGYAHDPQHTAITPQATQPLQGIVWQTPVDESPQYSGDDLLIHYGSPLATAANTVIVPVKTGPDGGFEVCAFDGGTGAAKWRQTTDYVLPPHGWVPSFSPTLTLSGRLYFAGAGGTLYYITAPDATGTVTTGQVAFYGLANYSANKATFDGSVFINTPLTADSQGNLYFGFVVTGANPAGLSSGFARIDAAGNGTWISASVAAADASIIKPVMNAAPALSNDGQKLYVVVSQGNFGSGYLLALNSTTLSRLGAEGQQVRLKDPNGNDALLSDDGTASPTVGPNGDVFFGVLENPFPYNHDRGWLLHFSGDLKQTNSPGAFGWDDTASIVPATMVPGYSGSSSYLLLTKYNNYAGAGGDGVNKLAVVDPTATMTDPITGTTVMNAVLTIAGVTPDSEFIGFFPAAVREWCINTAVVDPQTGSVLVNNEDGKLYRWNLQTNSLSESVTLTTGIGEAYTPTLVGPDGKVYAINNATLFAVGLKVNQPPVAGDLSLETVEDVPLEISAASLVAASNDADHDPLTVLLAIGQGPSHGTLSLDADGNLLYMPNADFNGSDQFGYHVSDGQATSNLATISITVTAVNDPPTFLRGNDQQATDEDGPRTILAWASHVAAGPANEAGQTLTFQVTADNPSLFLTQPAIDASGNLSFTPEPNADGTMTVTVVLHDDGGTATGGSDTSQPQTFSIAIAKLHPLHNAANSLDVDADQFVAPGDALEIIDYLNIPDHRTTVWHDPGIWPYYDVSADGFISPLDALLVINYLNIQPANGSGESPSRAMPIAPSIHSVTPPQAAPPMEEHVSESLLDDLAADTHRLRRAAAAILPIN